jgi:formylglycine-generating enzyme required for sulfatase activity
LAEGIENLKNGVVKITAHVDGKTKTGTGFIVRLEKETAYIITASYVVEGDPQPKVVFRPDDTKVFPAHLKGLEGDDRRGLAALVVKGNLPDGLETLPLNQDFHVTGGEEGIVIGFPLVPAVPWAVTSSVMTGQHGKYLVFSGAAVEGNSGGPIMVTGKVVGVVTEVSGQYGYAVPIPIVRLALRGWGVQLGVAQERATAQPLHEIAGKDGAPMVLIPAGTFMMGSTKGEVDRAINACVKELGQDQATCEGWHKAELPQHKVRMDEFYLDKYEVTNRIFQQFVEQTGHQTTAEKEGSAQAFVEGTGWQDMKGASWRQPEGGQTVFASDRSEHPVVSVSWDDADAFCRWAEKRLPTEAEWEYATRAGTTTRYWWGNGSPESRQVENLADETAKNLMKSIMTGYDDGSLRTAPVGSYEGNPWGLHDMSGNVTEWTMDWSDETYYKNSPERNPKGPSSGQYRVVRGGSWVDEPVNVRSAVRGRFSPSDRYDSIGFRCAQDRSN